MRCDVMPGLDYKLKEKIIVGEEDISEEMN